MQYDPEIRIGSDSEVYPPSDDSILLIESLDVSPGERVLEVGCGSGVVSIHCAVNGCARGGPGDGERGGQRPVVPHPGE